ncbi:MAG TPA: TRAP transporter large permease subunit [Casimicrobiaceae bacterium]
MAPFRNAGAATLALTRLLHGLELLSGVVLALDVGVVFVAVIYRYFLHNPVDWAEEIARALMVMQVFVGAATVLGRERHVGIDTLRGLLPRSWGPAMVQLCYWIIVGVSIALFLSSCELFIDSLKQTTSFGLPQIIFVLPVVFGSLVMALFGVVNALAGPRATVWKTLAASVALSLAVWAWNTMLPAYEVKPWFLLFAGFFGGLIIGVPIAFVLAFASLLFFLSDPSLPMLVWSQTVVAGMDHFVLLAIPFFVLAGMVMEANGMSARLIELLLRVFGRMRGGLNLITITATAFFSGISGSKLADIAAVGGIIMPAVRRTRQDPNDAAGLLAATAVMAETIPPCVNMIILGFVANISIGGLFMAGLIPAGVLALALAGIAIYFGQRIDPDEAFEVRTPTIKLIAGALVGLVMILMIGKGVTSGIATSTEVSAFAVVYAFVVGGFAFRELTWRSGFRLFVQAGSMTGTILFIVAAASSVSYALTILQIPQYLSSAMINLGHQYGSNSFVVVSVLLMILFGAVLEGAPALIIFGPLLAPIAMRLGVHPLHFGTVMVIAMGLGLFSPPIGLGLFATCAITGTKLENVWRPMLKYLLILFVVLIMLVFVPTFSLWLPARLGLA